MRQPYRTVMDQAVASQALAELPKISLHCHLEGSVRESTVRELAALHGIALDVALDRSLYEFADFGAFLRRFRDVCTVLAQPADYGRILREFIADARRQNIVYSELFLSPAGWSRLHPKLDIPAVMNELRQAADEGRKLGIDIHFLLDLTRNFGPEIGLETARLAVDCREYGVIGIGVGGDEAAFPGPLFASAFDLAHAAGLHCTAHAGEAAGPASVRETVEELGVSRIGHGVRAVEDPSLLPWLAERGVGFEQSPTSNLRTGVLARREDHPLRQFVEAGIRVAVDADDPPMFGTTVTAELGYLERAHGFAFACDRLRDAVHMSFAPAVRKAELFAELEAALARRPDRP